MYYEVVNPTNEDIQITISGVTYKIINIPANRVITVEKNDSEYFVDSTNKLVIRQIP